MELPGFDRMDKYQNNLWQSRLLEDFNQSSNGTVKLGKNETTCPTDTKRRCRQSHPYQCLRGKAVNSCTNNPELFDNDNNCLQYCNVNKKRNAVSKDVGPLLPPIPLPLPKKSSKLRKCPTDLNKVCSNENPYQCLAGDAIGGCSSDANTWENSPACTSYCNIFEGEQATPSPVPSPVPSSEPPTSNGDKIRRCPTDVASVCDPSVPYQCLAGKAINGCAIDASTWENSPDCTSYCNFHTGSHDTPVKKERNLVIVNNCSKPIWIGTYGANYTPANGGFYLGANTRQTITVPSNWQSGRIWARTGCQFKSNGNLVCETGDCNGKLHCKVTGDPPVTLAEFTFSDQPNIPDYYDVSLVDGFNLNIRIKPIPGSYQNVNNPDLGRFNCGTIGCSNFDMKKCPPELTIRGKDGTYCASICTAVNNPNKVDDPSHLKNMNKALVCCSCDCGPECGCSDPKCKYGCSPYDNSPGAVGGKCDANDWPLSSDGRRYHEIFKNQCPDAYSWQFDDLSSTYQCVNADYEISFC